MKPNFRARLPFVIAMTTFGLVLLGSAFVGTPVYGASCAAPPSGLVAWWPFEGDATDITGAHVSTIVGAVSSVSGEVGLALALETVPSGVAVSNAPDLNFGPGADFSIEAWIKPETASTSYDVMDVVDKRSVLSDQSAVGYELYLGSGRIAFQISDSSLSGPQLAGLTGPDLRDGAWHHVAASIQRASTTGGNLYVDGVLISTFDPTGHQGDLSTTQPLLIGLHPSYPAVNANFKGAIDEVSLYHRALLPAEVQSIFAAGSAGKCVTPTPPAIFAQPVNQKVIAGDDTSFSVLAGGAPPLSYQWSFEGTSIAGATAPTLTLTNVQPAQAGVYAVTITNSLGSLLSSNATLTVNFPPARVWLPDASAPAGNLLGDSLLTVPVYLVANGNENALGFSLNFSPSLLGNVSVALGSAASGGALLVNTNAAPNGTLGIALALPTGATFPPGTQEVADVVFAVSAQTNGSSTPITFGDLPIARQLSDASGQMLAASFSGGTVTVSVAFEGDASPRPNGDNDVTITDWVLLGRYAARLDYPTNGSEFQRADCAPRTTLGDGHITVADWVQAGRYAARLDPLDRGWRPNIRSGDRCDRGSQAPRRLRPQIKREQHPAHPRPNWGRLGGTGGARRRERAGFQPGF